MDCRTYYVQVLVENLNFYNKLYRYGYFYV